jgi:hypothetical protein
MDSHISVEELLYEEEGTTLDFKREAYKFRLANDIEKSELLKDILAFSNAWRRTDAYILLGVEEVKGGRSKVHGINDELDDAHLQQFVNSKTQRPIEFDYRTVLVDCVKIGIIRIPVQAKPFFLEKDYGKLKRHVVYIRRGSSTDEANPDEIRNMGRSEIQEMEEIPALSFEFADLTNRVSLGNTINLDVILLDIPTPSEIPDYREERGKGIFDTPTINRSFANPHYYRELVRYYFVSNNSSELAFQLRNDSNKVISDIRVELVIAKLETKFSFFKASKFPPFPKRSNDVYRLQNSKSIVEQIAETNRKYIVIEELKNSYRIEVPFEKAQPKQTVFSSMTIFLSSLDNFIAEAKVTIYADNIPIPIKQTLFISCNVTNEEGSLEHIEELHDKWRLSRYSN